VYVFREPCVYLREPRVCPCIDFFCGFRKAPLIALDEGDRVIGYFLLPFFGLQPTDIIESAASIAMPVRVCPLIETEVSPHSMPPSAAKAMISKLQYERNSDPRY
jgi:hypothetical protein